MVDTELIIVQAGAARMKCQCVAFGADIPAHIEELLRICDVYLGRILPSLAPVAVGSLDITGSGDEHEAQGTIAPLGLVAAPARD